MNAPQSGIHDNREEEKHLKCKMRGFDLQKRPLFWVRTLQVKLHVGSAAEGKNVGVNLHPVSSAKDDFKQDVKQNVTLVQPMVEVMAISEVCVSGADIPVVNIFGNRENFRPLLYFKEYNVVPPTNNDTCFLIHLQQFDRQGSNIFALSECTVLMLLLNLFFFFSVHKLIQIAHTTQARLIEDFLYRI